MKLISILTVFAIANFFGCESVEHGSIKKLNKSEYSELSEFKLAKDEIEKYWDKILENTSDGAYPIFRRGKVFLEKNEPDFKMLFSLKKEKIVDAKIIKPGIVEFIVKRKNRFDKDKVLLHVIRYDKSKSKKYSFDVLDSKIGILENDIKVLYREIIENNWTYEIWAMGIG